MAAGETPLLLRQPLVNLGRLDVADDDMQESPPLSPELCTQPVPRALAGNNWVCKLLESVSFFPPSYTYLCPFLAIYISYNPSSLFFFIPSSVTMYPCHLLLSLPSFLLFHGAALPLSVSCCPFYLFLSPLLLPPSLSSLSSPSPSLPLPSSLSQQESWSMWR